MLMDAMIAVASHSLAYMHTHVRADDAQRGVLSMADHLFYTSLPLLC